MEQATTVYPEDSARTGIIAEDQDDYGERSEKNENERPNYQFIPKKEIVNERKASESFEASGGVEIKERASSALKHVPQKKYESRRTSTFRIRTSSTKDSPSKVKVHAELGKNFLFLIY